MPAFGPLSIAGMFSGTNALSLVRYGNAILFTQFIIRDARYRFSDGCEVGSVWARHAYQRSRRLHETDSRLNRAVSLILQQNDHIID